MSSKHDLNIEHAEQTSAARQDSESGNHDKAFETIVADGTIRLYDATGDLRLIPIPSTDVNDPLRISEWRKFMILVAFCLFTAASQTATASISSIIPQLTVYYSEGVEHPPSATTINSLGSLPSLFTGIGAILSVIAALWVGTRPVMLFDATLATVCMIWASQSRGADRGLTSHIASRCFLGLGVGASESLFPLIIQEIHYIHRRNSQLALIWSVGGIVSAGVGCAASWIVEGLSWRDYHWVLFAPTCLSLILMIIFVPETTWIRTAEDFAGMSVVDHQGFAQPVYPTGYETRNWMYSLRLYSKHGSAKRAFIGVQDLVRCSLFPNVVWMILLNAVLIGSTIASSLVFGRILVMGYHWKFQYVGLLQLPLAVGSVVAIPVIGFGGDWLVKMLAKKKQGIHEPEHQLINLILPVTCGFVGTLCFGIFVQSPEKYHWICPMAMLSFQFFALIAGNVISITYAIECFPDLADSMVIAIGAYRNLIGFGLTYSVVAFVEKDGYLGCFGTYAAILGFLGICGIPFYIFGKKLRHQINSWPVRHSRAAKST